MPKSARTCVFFPRRKEGEDAEPGPLTRRVHVNYETLEGLFHLPLKDAARELGLCPTTFKKACRSLNVAQWPSREAHSRTLFARRDSQTDGVDAAIRMLHQRHVYANTPPTLQTTEVHQAMTCTAPGWHDGSFAWSDASAFRVSFSSTASSRSTLGASPELPWDCPDPFGAGFSSAVPHPCVEAVMDYLDGPLAGNFDFMFADEEVGAPFDRDNNGAEY
mmetsp:Transcript_10835/g.26269  ORF Transcript_10835/g.26269 Transcript_10835/m.26269 type:complete len:219 (-) Transcript_10835:223-879(-)